MKKLLLLLSLLPLGLCAQSFQTELGAMLSGSEMRERYALPPSRIQLRYGASSPKLTFFDVKNKIGYQGFRVGNNKAFQIGVFQDYVNFTETRVLTSEVEVSENHQVYIHGFLNADNKFFVLYSVNDKENDKEYVYVNELSESMKVLGTPMLLITFGEKKNNFSPIYFFASPDKKSFVVVREYAGKGATARVEVKAFDQHFAELYKTSIDVAGLQENFLLGQVAIDDNHNLYLAGMVDPKARQRVVMAGAKSKATPLVLTYDAKTRQAKPVTVGEAGIEQYYNCRFLLTPDNEAVVVSVFKSGKQVGYKVCHLENPALNYTGRLSDRARAMANKRSSDARFLEVLDFHKLPTGEYVFSLEPNFIVSSKYGSYSVSLSTILIGLDRKGAQSWETLVHKFQATGDDKTPSHRSFVTGSGLVMLYNDHYGNLDRDPASPKIKKYTKVRQSVPVVLEVNAQGAMKKYPLSKEADLTGFYLDMDHFVEIEKGQYQVKIAKDSRFKYQTAYGKIGAPSHTKAPISTSSTGK